MKREKITNVENEFLKMFNNGESYNNIVSKLNVSKSAISKYVKDNNLIHPSKVKHINESAFDIFTEESVYWLGFLWADGYVEKTKKNNTIDLELIDKEHIIKFQKFLNIEKFTERQRNNSITYRVYCSSKKIVNKLYDLGFNIKDKRTSIPTVPEEYLLSFIRGYFDGDGHIRIKNNKLEGIDISGRKEFMLNIYNKFKYFSRIERYSANSLRIYTNLNMGIRFLKDIYTNATIYLKRKYDCALSYLSKSN